MSFNGQPPTAHDNGDDTEETPLLTSSSLAPAQDADITDALTPETHPSSPTKSFPRTQIFLLCHARLVEPIAFFSIFPYINAMLMHNEPSLHPADVGFNSGLIESLFSLTQMSVMLLWGKAADRIGRKPVLVSSLFGVCIATSLFGMATTIWQMVLFRCLAGVFAGTIVTIRTMIGEHSIQETQARSFSFFSFAGNLGILLGPLVGGALAEPATQYPGAFGRVRFLEQYPYALPSFAVGLVGLSAVITSALFVEETLKKGDSKVNRNVENGQGPSDEEETNQLKPISTWELVKTPGVGIVLYVYGHVMLLAFAYTAIIPVFLFTPVELGGFGFSPFQISMFMGLTGFSQAIWGLFIFPPLQHLIGTNGVMRLCGIAYPFFLATCPLLNLILRQHKAGTDLAFWIAAPIFLAIGPAVSMSFTAIQLALNDVSPSPDTLGTLNALALTGMSALRSFTPALFTSLFAIGASTQALWGYLIWLVMVLLAAGFAVAVRYLPKVSEKYYPSLEEDRLR